MTTRSGVLVGGLAGPRYVNETTPPRQGISGAVYLDALARNTGTASVTLDAVTLAATGALRIAGTLTKTLDDATLAATGVLPIKGTLSATLADVTASGTGVLPIQGTESKTLDDVTLVATATLRITGALNATLDDVTLVATATKPAGDDLAAQVAAAKGTGGVSLRRRRRKVEGAIAWVLPRLSLTATGEASDPPEGEFRAGIQLDAIRLHARGAVGARGFIRIDMPPLSLRAAAFIAPCGNARAEIVPILRGFGRHDHFNDAELALLPLLLEIA
jgi:hypothetical protein